MTMLGSSSPAQSCNFRAWESLESLSVGLDLRRLDDFREGHDLGADQRGELIRRRRPGGLALPDQLFLDVGHVQHFPEIRGELLDDRLRRRGRCEYAVPVGRIESR